MTTPKKGYRGVKAWGCKLGVNKCCKVEMSVSPEAVRLFWVIGNERKLERILILVGFWLALRGCALGCPTALVLLFLDRDQALMPLFSFSPRAWQYTLIHLFPYNWYIPISDPGVTQPGFLSNGELIGKLPDKFISCRSSAKLYMKITFEKDFIAYLCD
jgi:hypothetical protein